MKNKENEKEIIPIKIQIDIDTEIRATNFYGSTKTGKIYNPTTGVCSSGRMPQID